MEHSDIVEFNRSKIYEKLDYESQPENYRSSIPWVIQQQISATNGRHYARVIGKLDSIPVYQLPVPEATVQDQLFLDIGCGWGRWLIAAANKRYLPVGMDLRLEFCETALATLTHFNRRGYAVVADLENIPFLPSLFDLVWSFSVIQHTHSDRLHSCLAHINRILNPTGFTYLELPNSKGLRNRLFTVEKSMRTANDYNSWCVRYYSQREYRKIFEQHLADFSCDVHSFLGIGVLPEDVKYLSGRPRIMAALSLFLTKLSRNSNWLKGFADSYYIKSSKKGTGYDVEATARRIRIFRDLHAGKEFSNLNIWPLLRCPKYGGELTLSHDRKRLIAPDAGVYYRVENDVPILISSEASPL